MKVICAQFDSVWQDAAANIEQLQTLMQQCMLTQPDVVVLPELFHSGFSMDIANIVQSRSGPLYQQLSQLAQQYCVYLIAGVALDAEHKKALNSALVFDRNGVEQACYVKNHPFTYGKEEQFYQAGNQQIVFEIEQTPCTVFICYDLRFPELFRKLARQVEMTFVIANWPASRQAHWQTLLRARAIENQCFMVGVNRIGDDGNGLHYAGGSMVVDPLGEVLCSMQADEAWQLTEIDVAQVKQVRQQFPFLQDMKPVQG